MPLKNDMDLERIIIKAVSLNDAICILFLTRGKIIVALKNLNVYSNILKANGHIRI